MIPMPHRLKRYWPLVGVLLALAVSDWLSPPKPPQAARAMTTTAPVAPALTDHTMKGTYAACATPDEYHDLIGLSGDEAAFKTRLVQRMMLGQCAIFSSGERVIITDVGIWSGLVRIRKPGNPDAYWLYTRYVD